MGDGTAPADGAHAARAGLGLASEEAGANPWLPGRLCANEVALGAVLDGFQRARFSLGTRTAAFSECS